MLLLIYLYSVDVIQIFSEMFALDWFTLPRCNCSAVIFNLGYCLTCVPSAQGFDSEMEIKTRGGSVWNCSVILGGRLPASLCCDTQLSAEKAHALGATLGWLGWAPACWTASRQSVLTGQTGEQLGDWRWSLGQGKAVSRAYLDGGRIWNAV